MKTRYLTLLTSVSLLFLTLACVNWSDLSNSQRSSLTVAGLRAVVKPECVRLDQLKDLNDEEKARVVALCEEVVEDVIVAVGAGFAEDPSLICPSISAKADQCEAVITTKDPISRARNVATCERVINAAGLACTVGLMRPAAQDPEPAS
jgi:hypothetical protein